MTPNRNKNTTKIVAPTLFKYKTNGVTNYEKSGFYDAWFRLKGVEGVNHMEFDREDSVRHPLVKRILKTYEDEHLIDLSQNDSK